MLTLSSLILILAPRVWAHPTVPWAEVLLSQLQEIPLTDKGVPTQTSARPLPWADLFSQAQQSSPVEGAATRPLPWAELYAQAQQSTPVQSVAASKSTGAMSLIYKFDDTFALENIAVRPNGNLLLTVSDEPEVWIHDPTKKNSKPSLLHHFDGATSTLGIVETTPDIFAVVVGNYTGFEGIPGSFSLWSLDFTGSSVSAAATTAAVKQITKIPEAKSLNGIASVDGTPTMVLAADSQLGAIWKVDSSSGKYSMPVQHALLTNCTGHNPLAVNGLIHKGSKLYFSNSALNIFGRIPMDDNIDMAGEIEIVARAMPGVFAYDDFCMDWAGNTYIGSHPDHLTQIAPEGQQRNFTGGDDVKIQFPTSVAFGRGSKDQENDLYIVTSKGQLIQVDLCQL